MRQVLYMVLALGCGNFSPTFCQTTFFEKADQFFRTRQINNRINYQLLVDEPAELQLLVSQISTMNVDSLNAQSKKAFYINAYNLLVIKGVVDHYPFANLEEVPGFFKNIFHDIAGQQLSLDQIEFQHLVKDPVDPRLHFVLNCGAYSCPTLYNEAIRPEEIEEQLNSAITLVMDRDDYVFVDHESKTVLVSKIFDWYGDDFRQNGSLRQFINFHRFTSIPSTYEIKFQEYDWRLNDSNNKALR